MKKKLSIFVSAVLFVFTVSMLVASCFIDERPMLETEEKPHIQYSAVQYDNAKPLPDTGGPKLLR